MMINKSKYLLAVLVTVAALGTGCSNRFQPEQSAPVTITPLTIAAEGLDSQGLNAFLSHHRTALLIEPVLLRWQGDEGRADAREFARRLLDLGADGDNLMIREAPEALPGVTVSYRMHAVQTPTCAPYRSLNMFNRQSAPQGCFVDSNRWQSLLHPERSYQPQPGDRAVRQP